MNGILLRRHPKDQRRLLKDHRRHPKDQRRRPEDQRRHHLRINVLMSNTSIYVVLCVFNLVWTNLMHPWILDFFGIIFASFIEHNSAEFQFYCEKIAAKLELTTSIHLFWDDAAFDLLDAAFDLLDAAFDHLDAACDILHAAFDILDAALTKFHSFSLFYPFQNS